MSKRANPTLVGGFVLGAVALVFVAVLLFGGGRFLQSRVLVVAYFDGSVRGLAIGAPVTLHGVRVGSVTDVQLEFDPDQITTRIPVYMEFEKSKVVNRAGLLSIDGGVDALVARGLRAQLQTQSFVTGQLYVDLDFTPNAVVRRLGANSAALAPEIPTVRTDLEDLRERLSNLPLEDLVNRVALLLQSADRLLNSPEIPGLIASLVASAGELQGTLAAIRGEVSPLAQETTATLGAIRAAADQAGGVLEKMKGAAGDASELMRRAQSESTQTLRAFTQTARTVDQQLAQTAAALKTALKQVETLANSANSLVAPNSPPHADIEQTLRNLAQSTRALRGLAEQLERNPNALLLGKR